MNVVKLVCLLIFCMPPSQLDGAVKGSATAVSIEDFFTFPSADNDNSIQGFAWFKNGFSLEDSSTTCTFNSVYPVSGTVNLNGGTVYLLQDLVLRNILHLDGLGTIYGSNHTIDLCADALLPSQQLTINSVKLALSHDLVITNTVMIKGDCELCGFGKVVTLQGDGQIIIDTDARLTLCNMELRGIHDEKVRCVDDTGRIVLDNVKWVQDDFTKFSHGSIYFKDHVDIIGSTTFSYDSSQTSTIAKCSCMHISPGMHLCLGRHKDTLNEPLAHEDSSSCLHLDNCSFVITDSGICLTKGVINLVREVTIDVMGTTTQTGLITGDGNPENDITIWFAPGAAATHNSGYWVYNNSTKDLLKSASKTSRMIRNLGSKIYVPKDLELNDLTVELNSNLVPPIEVESSAQLSYMNAAVALPDIDFGITSNQVNAFTYCLNGNDEIVLQNGTLPLYMLVTGAGNQLRGNGGMTGAITLLDVDSYLTCGINGFIDNTITLNNGTFAIAYDLFLCRNALLVGPGTVNLGGNQIDFESGLTPNSSIHWIGDKGTLLFNGKISLSHTWTVQGNCRIVGNDAKLVLEDGGEIVIDEDSSLTLKTVPVYGVRDENIRCVDDAGTLTLLKSQLNLADDFVFKKGKIQCYLKNVVSGAYTFSYDSAVPAIIRQDARLSFQKGATCAIGSKNGVNQISFEHKNSYLAFYDANLNVHETGLSLMKGSLLLDGRVNLDMLGSTTDTGFIMGDGVDADNDIDVILSPAMAVSHNTGYWVYNNVSSTAIQSVSPAARLIRSGDSKIYLPRSLHAKNFTVELDSLLINPVEVAPTAQVSYENALVRMPGIQFDASCNQLNAFTYNLDGGDSVFITKGTLPLYMLVQNSLNSVLGNGSISGGITLYDANAQLSCGLNGVIDNFIMLNGGTLSLTNDLQLGSNGSLNGPGIVSLSNNEFSFPINAQTFTTPIYWNSNDGGINVRGTVSLASTWTIKGTCKLNGIDSKFALASGGSIVIDSDSELVLENVRLYGLHDENIRCVDNTGKITLINSEFVQMGDTTFSKGSMEMYLKNSVSGAYTFSYDSVMTSTIKSDGQCSIKGGMILVCGRNGGNEPIYLEDRSATMKFQDSTMLVKETGMKLMRGTFIADRDVVVDVVGTDSTTGLIFGDGTADNDMITVLNPGATARFPSGFVQYNITEPNGIRSKTKSAQLIRGAGSHFDLKHNLDLADMTVDVNLYSQLSIDPGKLLSYTNGRIVLPQGVFDLTGVRYSATTTLLNGDDKIVLVNGSLPLATLVMGESNSIEGNGNVAGPIILSGLAPSLSFNVGGYLFGNVAIGGGVITLAHDLHLANGILITGDGIINVGSHNLELGKSDLTWPGNIFWQMDGGSIGLHGSLDLQGTWTFNGKGEIKGNGQSLDLQNGTVVIDQGSQLVLRNVQIENMNCHHIKCLGDDSILILDNVLINQHDEHVRFTKGSLQFKNGVIFSGEGVFVYETDQTSTICKDSFVQFDSGITFSYDPASASRSLISFESDSSSLRLNGSSLHITCTAGIILEKGFLETRGNCSLRTERYIVEQDEREAYTTGGCTLGDGISSANDYTLTLQGGSVLCLEEGSLIYQNKKSDSFYAANRLSTLCLKEDTSLILNESLDVKEGSLVMNEAAHIINESGKTLIGSIRVE